MKFNKICDAFNQTKIIQYIILVYNIFCAKNIINLPGLYNFTTVSQRLTCYDNLQLFVKCSLL